MSPQAAAFLRRLAKLVARPGRMQTMTSQEHEPQLGAESFSCPHCNAVAHQDWYSLFLKPENATEVVALTLEAIMLAKGEDSDQFARLKDNVVTYEYEKHPRSLKVRLVNLHVSRCSNCKGFAIWVRDRLVFPIEVGEAPHTIEADFEEVGEDVQEPAESVEEVLEDFEEAAAILNKFPRGAAALTRICIQRMMPLVKGNAKNPDENFSSLVRKGLEVEIQQAMDVLQVVGKSPLQLSEVDLEEENETTKNFLTH
jgi:hypothetical protein